MVAIRSFYADDPAQDAADILAAKRDLERLRYAEPKTAEARAEVARCVAVNERWLVRMRGTA